MANFQVTVNSERNSQGTCYGHVSTKVYMSAHKDGLFGNHVVADKGSIFLRSKNANTLVLEVIKKLIDEMKEEQK